MHDCTPDALEQIQRVHSIWIQCELAQDTNGVLALCSDEIELRPPNAAPVVGRAAVCAYLIRSRTRVHDINISDLRVRLSNELAYLTANYATTFSSPEDATPRVTAGSHLWILQRHGATWRVVLVAWSVWTRAEDEP